jgi:hypothetical protein
MRKKTHRITGEEMDQTHEIRGLKINGWGLVRGFALLFSSLIVITALHHLILAFFRG